MNYDFNSIESLLRSGVSADEIAQAFTKNLNDAINVTKRDSKRAELYENLAKSWNEVLRDWADNHEMPDGVDFNDLMLDGPHTEEVVGQFMDLVAGLAPVYKAFVELTNEKPAPVKKNTVAKFKDEDIDAEDFDALVNSFLNSIK